MKNHWVFPFKLEDNSSFNMLIIFIAYRCKGRSPSISDAPFCFRGDSWENVTLGEFMNCPTNLARNRQTRMLANLTKIGMCTSASLIRDWLVSLLA